MFMSRFLVERDVRHLPRRRPVVEALEGRQLLSTFAANDFRSAPVQPAIVGNHIGTNVAVVQRKHIGADVAMIQGNHIGSRDDPGEPHRNRAMIQGNHIGTNVAVDVLPNGGVARKH